MSNPNCRAGAIGLLLAFGVSSTVLAQEPRPLAPGLNEERTLGPSDKHRYTITLQEGTAVIGEAVQHGVDLVIDEYGPDGKLIVTIDSPNGTEGPEPIEVTAFKSGVYELVVHTLDTAVAPGKYVIKIDSLLTIEQNGLRLAAKNYPPVLQNLWRASLNDSTAVDRFVESRKGKGPIVEKVEGDSSNVRVTYFYYGDEYTDKVRTSGGPHQDAGGILMIRFMKTPLFFAQEIVPIYSRFTYNFAAIQMRFIGPKGSVQVTQDVNMFDRLNPDLLGRQSVLTIPGVPPPPYIERLESVPRGKLASATIESAALKEKRPFTIYTPPGYDGKTSCNLVVIFDGEDNDGGSSAIVSTPTTLDNLQAAGKVDPLVAVFVYNVGHRQQDLTGVPSFAGFIGGELIPWVRKTYNITQGASHVVVAGKSLGGLASAHCAFMHPESIGNVLSQSGSYWITKDWQHRSPWPLTDQTGDLIGMFTKSKRLPIKFYIDIGRFENSGTMLGSNRELRDVLLLKGYDVTYKELDGGHQMISWRDAFPGGLIALLGRP